MKDIDHLFCIASELLESNKLNLFSLSDGTRIDDNEYLKILENAKKLAAQRLTCLKSI